MLALGRALMSRPSLLMLDEPSLGLAPLVVKEIFQTIKALRQTGVTTLLVEQNARAALEAADYGYVLEMGEIVLSGQAGELAGEIAEQRKKSRGAKITLIPVDARVLNAHMPLDAPAVAKTLLARPKSGT